MAAGISDVLAYAVGTAISPVPIIAVILMLFSARARVNGPVFLLGWAIALTVVSSLGYLLSDAGDAAADSTAADSVNWFQIVIGVLFLLLAVRTWRRRPAEGAEAEMQKWMAGIDSFPPGRAFVLALLLAGVNPKNLLLGLGAGSSLAVQRPSATVAAVSIAVFVAVGSLTIAGPVGYYLVGKDRAKTQLDATKDWLTVHNSAVMTVLFVVLGVNLIAKGIPPLASR